MLLYDCPANRRSPTLVLVNALVHVQEVSLIANKPLDDLYCDWRRGVRSAASPQNRDFGGVLNLKHPVANGQRAGLNCRREW
jgi:hypothetical protein